MPVFDPAIVAALSHRALLAPLTVRHPILGSVHISHKGGRIIDGVPHVTVFGLSSIPGQHGDRHVVPLAELSNRADRHRRAPGATHRTSAGEDPR